MSRRENETIIRRFIQEFWNEKKLAVADELFAPDATCPSAPQLPPGPAGVKMVANMVFTGFPDFQMKIDKIVADDDRVCAHYIETGTQKGEFLGVKPTNKRATWNEMGILRIKNGKVVESWFTTDMLSLMQQLGAVPSNQ